MAKTINITNGTGSESLINGTYSVTANVNGYSNTTIDPSTLNIVDGTNTYSLTIAATGTLTIHVTEDGTSTGTPVVGATFVRTDSEGNVYGSTITTDSNGDAVMSNVPFATTSAPVIYYKQTASDGNHEFSTSVASTSLTTDIKTIEIINAPGEVRTISLTDTNYANLPIGTGTITLTD